MTFAGYTPAEKRTRTTFLALMWSLSYPGRSFQLSAEQAPFELIAETLLDLETTYCLSEKTTIHHAAQSGARMLPPERAAYHFYEQVTEQDLKSLAQASVGTMPFPDEGATLILGGGIDSGARFELTGPGVNGSIQVQIDRIPSEFWILRERACQFPLGWDIFIVDERRVIGLPRSVKMKRTG
ncbi:MAG: phosphonate C-P lyase system protein PhnH [bacterium]|nr:phosphonate C-P lyase system protein PhnH [bacterium]